MSYFRLRLGEWATSLVLFAMGLISLVYPQTFNRPGLGLLHDNAVAWTILCLIIGSARLIALVINGHWRGGTPAIRLVGCLIGASMFGALSGSILGGTSSTFGVSWGATTYGVLMLMEFFNAYFAASDVANVRKYGG